MHEGPELIQLPPERLDSLADLTDQARTAYEPAEGGGYTLKAAAREAIEQLNDEITSKWAKAEKRWAEMDAEIAHKDEFIRHLAVKNAIDNALVSCGVKSTFFRAAEAVLFDHLDIEVQEDSDGQVMVSALGPYGRTTIASAVASWPTPTRESPSDRSLPPMRWGRLLRQ